MPETPDFDAIATRIYFEATGATLLMGEDIAPIVEQLRLVWNARGEADMRELAAPVSAIVDAIRSLDR
jgi:hypothetical protein